MAQVIVGLVKSDHCEAERRLTPAEGAALLQVEGVARAWEAREPPGAERETLTAQLLREVEQKNAELAQLQHDNRELQTTLQRNDAELAQLQHDHRELQTTLHQLQQDNGRLQHDNRALQTLSLIHI